MKTSNLLPHLNRLTLLLIVVFTFTSTYKIIAQQGFAGDVVLMQTTEYKGKVVNSETGDPIASAHLLVSGTNISTITNNEGEFSLKITDDLSDAVVVISYLGFKSKSLPISYFKEEGTRIELEESIEELSSVNLFYSGDARSLVETVLKNRDKNYLDEPIIMTAFYRESIKKRKQSVSLSEAVVKIYKQPYNNLKKDDIEIYKARKSTNYEKLDTLALKLRGGPFNTLYVDIMKYPEFLFEDFEVANFQFDFDVPTKFNERYIYVVNFSENDRSRPWYYGKLFIDSESLSLVKASYRLNVDDRELASKMFVKKKPGRVKVYPTEVLYSIDYRQSNGKWHYGYGSAKLEFLVNWKFKLFNSRYTLNSEMAVTDWEKFPANYSRRTTNLLKPSVVMVDDVSGFSDDEFWGNSNIIEPDKSIQNAIQKIQRQLEKENK